jgi:hypothetical protein
VRPEVAQVADGVAAGGVGAEALDEGGLALEHAAHAVEVGDERRVGQLRLDARQLLLEGGGLGPRGGEDLAHRCARRRRPSGAGRRRARRGAAVTAPASGCSSPASIFSSVDLPAPLAPIRPTRARGTELEVGAVEDQAARRRTSRRRAATAQGRWGRRRPCGRRR